MKTPDPGGPLTALEELAAAARREPAPAIDVTQAVFARIRADAAAEDRPLAWLAASACAAAAFTAVLAWPALQILTDPLAYLFEYTPILGG